MRHTARHTAALLLGTLLALACGSPDTGGGLGGLVPWARARATEVEGGPGALAASSAEALREAFGSARLVGLGESRHDTREQFLLKAKLVRFMVTELGFRALILEESVPHVERLDAYVTTGAGDARRTLSATAGWYVWDTEEMLTLLQWLRRFNTARAPDEMVRLFGVDVTAPAPAARLVLEALHASGLGAGLTEESLALDLHDGDFWPAARERFAARSDAERRSLRQKYDALVELVERSRDTLLARNTPEEYARLLRLARVAADGNEFFCTEELAPAGNFRDRCMAAGTRQILEDRSPESRAILWAHNLHTSKAPFRMPQLGDDALVPMGVHLAEVLGSAYVAVAGSFGSGSYPPDLPPGAREFERLPPATMDGALARVGTPSFLLDLRTAPPGSELTTWLAAEREWRAQDAMARLATSHAFDLVYYVDEVTRATPTPPALEKFEALRDR
ncbi:MAG: erythromycin esterase family protein [bacterium]|nr:erythromycin esterase family protein [bacterium]